MTGSKEPGPQLLAALASERDKPSFYWTPAARWRGCPKKQSCGQTKLSGEHIPRSGSPCSLWSEIPVLRAPHLCQAAQPLLGAPPSAAPPPLPLASAPVLLLMCPLHRCNARGPESSLVPSLRSKQVFARTPAEEETVLYMWESTE